MPTSSLPLEDWIKTATAPGGGGVYFLGAFDRRITFYSQQVRGLRLVYALDAQGLMGEADRIAVVGAGAAGLSFALCAALLGYNVTLFDPADKVLQLQSASSRLLHPHIYEWPDIGSLDKRAGLPLLDWTSSDGGSVCTTLQHEFESALKRLPHLKFQAEHKLVSMERAEADWCLTLDHKGKELTRRFQKVILAMGFGEEIICGAAEPAAYWKPSGVGTSSVEAHSGATYFVSGNGDGGLTDILSLIIQNFEHVSFTREFLLHPSSGALCQTAHDVIASASVGDDLSSVFQMRLHRVIDEHGVIDMLRGLLRKDRVLTINSNGPLFVAGKASLLNQFMVYATLEAAKLEAVTVNYSRGLVGNVEKTATGFSVSGPLLADHSFPSNFEHVILRHGPDRRTRYAPARTSFDLYKAHIESLLTVTPSLAKPPTLEPELFDRFEYIKIQCLMDVASKESLLQQRDLDRCRIIIEIDAAARQLVERGHLSLLDAAQQCERLPFVVTVHLALPPTDLKDAFEMMRLSKASNGRIQLTTVEDHAAAWKVVAPGIVVTTTGDPRFRGRMLDPAFLRDKLDDCFLRLLDVALTTIITSGTCTTLHKVDESIRQEVASTWAFWLASLQISPALRFDFLRWLANIEQGAGQPWSGDHTQLPRMAAALFLMLAAHLGEPLTPASMKRGNLSFSGNAEALGSGCDTVEGGPLTVWDRPDQWGVDALILSGSAEVDVYSPDDTLLNAGSIGHRLCSARRVRPAIIRNDLKWRQKLGGSLANWKQAVQQEFEGWRQRVRNLEDEVSK